MNESEDTQALLAQAEVSQAIVVRQEAPIVERLPLDELHEQLGFIRQVMAREMKEGQDYGKIPGCGDKPGLFQPGAQKLLLTFQLTPHVKKEVLRELPHPTIFGHREYEFTISVRSKTGREWDGVGTCSTFESKYRYRKNARKCPKCGKEAINKDKKPPFGFYCWKKIGGCGANFTAQAPEIINQEEGKSDNENPAEFWNTVRKMAFKRAIVHASINATNTSELWSQDLEDIASAQSSNEEYLPLDAETDPQGIKNTKPLQQQPQPTSATPKPPPSASEPSSKTPSEQKKLDDWAKYRMKVLNKLNAAAGQPNRKLLTDFLTAANVLTLQQVLEDWPIKSIPTTDKDIAHLKEEMEMWHQQRAQADLKEELI